MRCIVIGNGPSLKQIPLEFLKKYDSIGSNRIYLLDGFMPTYYVCVNNLVIQQFHKEINSRVSCPKFISTYGAELIPNCTVIRPTHEKIFSDKAFRVVYEGHNVTYVALQLMYTMGYDEIGLIGVDHHYEYNGAPDEEQIASIEDPNHFAGTYFSGVRWNNPNLEASEEAYKLANDFCNKHGRNIVNLTPSSHLDIFEKVAWTEWA